jgi:hypothetical protein
MRPDDFFTERFATDSDALDANPFATLTVFNQELANGLRQRAAPDIDDLDAAAALVLSQRFVKGTMCDVAWSRPRYY